MSETKQKEHSPAYEILRLAWRHAGHQMGQSRDRDYHAMTSALLLAIEFGFEFYPDDFSTFVNDFSYGWRGACWIPADTECWYARATGSFERYHESRGYGQNRSACIAYENWQKRPAFIHKSPDNKNGRRLCVGSCVPIGNERWWVTSFGEKDGEHYVRLSLYAGHYPEGKPIKLKKLTLDDLRELNRAVDKAKAA